MNISREKFVEVISKMQKYERKCEQLNRIMCRLGVIEGYSSIIIADDLLELIIELLSISSGISVEAIYWYLYDSGTPKIAYTRSGKECLINSAEDFWDFEKVGYYEE